MTLKELNIINFKNIAEATLTFTSGFNCFVGNNGVGKTNVLDAYMQLGEYRKAAENYKKAAASKTNDFSTPTFLMKNGLALEKSNDYSGALKVYEQIEQEYPASPEGRDIEKYIERAQLKLKK
jgi:recombinational DNA repair ATPase RecF